MSSGKRVEAYGPRDAKIVVVGEAPGETEERHGVPFCGNSGEELKNMMEEVGLQKLDCYLTNVFKIRPPGNKLDSWLCGKKDLPPDYNLPALSQGKYLQAEFVPFLKELEEELAGLKPNLILLCGGTATWALGLGTITRARGVVTPTRFGKALGIYHPAAILRNWAYRPITLADLQKAKYESQFPEIKRPRRELWIEPTLAETVEFFHLYLNSAPEVSFDIENKGRIVTCISLAPSAHHSICIPLFDPQSSDGSYWTREEEWVIWSMLRHLLQTRPRLPITKGGVRLIAQNGLYDIQHLAEDCKLFIPQLAEDTMLLHHVLHPEMQKGLGFLGSVYTNELSWKHMVKDLGREK
jgi:uracil-DNA glycosylase